MSDIEAIKKIIIEEVFIKNVEHSIDSSNDPSHWMFDFRPLFMNGEHIDRVASIFYNRFKDRYPFQLGGLEVAAIPLVTACINKFYTQGHADVTGFFIRKSRKKIGLCNFIEGNLVPDRPIVLLDDILNSGDSLWRQVEILEAEGKTVDCVWVVMRYRDLSYYERFHAKGITIHSLFELNDFADVPGMDVSNLQNKKFIAPVIPTEIKWHFKSLPPGIRWVVQKSQPILDEKMIFFGTDNRLFYALNQEDGSEAWRFMVGPATQHKSIFSSPALYNNSVIFGSYDGSLYCLNKHTGALHWRFDEADWIGSSPCISENLQLVFVGLEFGLFRKRGGIVALNLKNGAPVWMDRSHVGLTHSTPYVIEKTQEVVIGSNDGVCRLYDAKNGLLKWMFTTIGGQKTNKKDLDTGFSLGDIKASFVYCPHNDYVVFGSTDSYLYVLDRATGTLIYHHKCDSAIYSTPLLFNGKVYFTSLDKRVRCLNLDTLNVEFDINLDNTRIFSSPAIHNNDLYVGTNAGRLHQIDVHTGQPKGYISTVERITNSVVYNSKTGRFFLPTYANEIIAFEK